MKLQVLNRNNVNLSVVVEGEKNKKGLVFLLHGLGGIKEQKHIRAVADTFLENAHTVITYDAAHTIGESGGRMEDATLTSYFEDLEDVVEWAKSQKWYKEPFIASGHSLGGACSILFAAKYPEKAKAIIPISAFIAGELYKATGTKKDLEEWRRRGYMLQESKSKPGVMKKIGWGFVEDALTYDLRKIANKITCPSLFITGSIDTGTPAAHQQMVIEKTSAPTELKIIERMAHNPATQEHIDELKNIIQIWITNNK